MDQPPNTVAKPPRWRRWLVRLALAACVMALPLVCLAIGVQLWKSSWQREVNRQLAELRAAGIPTTPAELEASYQLPPGVEDCTQLWLDATAPLAAAEKELTESGLPFVSSTENVPPAPGADWPQLAQAEAHLARFQASLDLMHEAARRGGAARYTESFEVDAGFPFGTALHIRVGCRVLQLQAHVSAHRGDTRGVLEALDTMLKLGQSLEGEPEMVPLLVRVAIHGVAQHTLEQLLPHLLLDEGQLAALQADWAHVDFATQLVGAVRGKRLVTLQYFAQPQRFDPEMAQGLTLLHGATGPYDMAYFLETIDRLEESATGPLQDTRTAAKALDLELAAEGESHRRFGRALSLMAFPATGALVDAVCRAATERDGTVAVVAGEQYRLRHGDWPAALGDMKPDLLPEIPIDPFDGQPLRYRVDDEGLCVYSIGKNGRDDGGVDDTMFGDIVFRIPRRKPAAKMDDQTR